MRNSVPNSVVLMFVRGWQGGTIHQIAADLGTTADDIQNADFDRMVHLMMLAQRRMRAKAVVTFGDTAASVPPPQG